MAMWSGRNGQGARAALAVAAVGMTLALGGAGAPARAQGAAPPAPGAKLPIGRISVSGRGVVHATPDMATLTLGVTTEARTAAEAMADNSSRVSKLFEALKAAGIAPRDMQTSGLSLGPRYSRATQTEPAKLLGFRASNDVTVRVRKLDGLGHVLDTLVRAGANTLDRLSFGVADSAALMDKARVEAVKDARRKAAMMAGAAGVELGPLLSLNEGGTSEPRPMLRMAAEPAPMAAPVPVARGELSLSASVSMVYAIRR